MLEFVLSLPEWVGVAVAMIAATVIGLVVYFAAYRLISKYQEEDLKDPMSSLFRVVGVLVGLMLSLAFSDVITQMTGIQNAVEREAVAISDAFYDLQQFDIEKTREARKVLIDYTQAIIDDDWPALADDGLGRRAGQLKRQLSQLVANLVAETPAQEKLLAKIETDMEAISGSRLIRLDNALAKPPVYVYVIMFGFLVTMACFGAYRPQVPLVALVSLYTAFVGLVLYLVLSLSDPFQGAIGVSPTTLEQVVNHLQSKNR